MSDRPWLKALNGLRFIVIMQLVMLHLLAHHRAVFGNEGPFGRLPDALYNLLIAGPTATGLFFILSGFILTYVYVDRDATGLRVSRSKFLINRVGRIYPLHALLLVALLMTGVGNPQWTTTELLVSLSLLQTFVPTLVDSWNTPAWAASCLMVLYLLFPWILDRLLALSGRGLLTLILALVALNWSLCSAFYNTFQELAPVSQARLIAAFYYSPMIWLPYFTAGVGAGIWRVRASTREDPEPLVPFPNVLLAIYLYLLLHVQAFPHVFMRHSLFMGFQILLIVSVAEDRGLLARLCRRPVLQRIAPASFTIYLMHVPLFFVWFRAFEDQSTMMPWWGVVGYLLVLLPMAHLTEHHLVRPIRRWVIAALGRQAG